MAALVAVAALAGPSGAGARTHAAAPAFHDGHGLEVTSVRQIDSRLFALVVKTGALPGPANIYILLPPDYGSRPRARFPVLYLLHGTSGTASDWTVQGKAENVIGNRELITVMPDIALNDGGGGWCTNWPSGAQRWETFHIDQLIPWVDANLRTIAARSGRAIAGLSQGGFCSTSYAARHPDLFSVVLGYSAAPDIYYDLDTRLGAMAIINATELGLDRVAPDTFFGDPATDAINWAAHDPATLAGNLRWTRIYMYWGNGRQGPYDTAPPGGATLIEGAVWRDNNEFQTRLDALGIPAYFDDYGPGTHSWPYWARDLRWSIDRIMFDFAHPAPEPSPFAYTSADDRYTVYGWDVTTHRTAREFSTLENANADGFALAGSGSATVLTPALYDAGRRYRVALSGTRTPMTAETIVAASDGRLQIEVPLGPPNPFQQGAVPALVAGSPVYTTSVTIERLDSL